MIGLLGDFKQKNHAFVGDCVISTDSIVGFAYYEEFEKILQGQEFVEAVSPVVKNFALVSLTGSEQNYNEEIMGIDPVKHSRVTSWGQSLHFKKNDISNAFVPSYDPNLSGCIMGIDIWQQRDPNGQYVYGPKPEKIALVINAIPLTAKGVPAKSGTTMINAKTFYNTDFSHCGLATSDSSMIYIPLEQGQLLCGMDGGEKRISRLQIKFKAGVELESGRAKVIQLWKQFVQSKAGAPRADLLLNVSVKTWKEFMGAFVAAMEKEQTMLIFMFGLVGVTTVFIVFVVFYMIISHKTKDIGILKSLGASNINVVQLFLGFAFLLGVLASAAGAAGGWLFLLKINNIEGWLYEKFGFQLWDRTIYAIGQIPNQVDGKVLGIIIICAIAACLIGALIPSWQTARLKPAKILQVNQI
jgi:lipoprotein-releasing system permease protein